MGRTDATDTDATDTATTDTDATDTATTDTDATDDDLPAFREGDHSGSWSANLELDRYADDRELVVEHALLAVERTEPGHHVNLVTHPEHGSPEPYLEDTLHERFPEATATVVDQCGCGGYVYRVET
ncbi:CGCGG family rSAM-modified RiPP protein [Halorubrum sp. 48-1-W]|uniref:CGCGG family putative rSAM-modified RiPP protein n=1 Tax=Halorubrum sp. 48-1-W TaxID=2249761 RepID=UPI000DCF59D8|nr:CGCGG family rSAM-modified RiPP protein [Halorubrum sp. 48-1-W]RAW47120.1 CGCGG family rSAM-modified RiPP protein [Halorubrum sp. 48-1-W]